MDVNIIDSIELQDEYSTVSERYYTTRFCSELDSQPVDDHCVMFHSNRICLITLAPGHPIIKQQKTIRRLNFQITDKLNRLDNKVSGKGKKGAQHLEPNSVLCKIECEDGTEYSVYSCVKGKLVEINSNLLENPELLVRKPTSDGYIAIILPQIAKILQWKEEMLTPDKYKEICNEKALN